MTHKPILHIYQDGDSYFAAPPSFVDLQSSPVAWLDNASTKRICFILKHVGGEVDTALYFSGDENDLANLGVEHWASQLDADPLTNEMIIPSGFDDDEKTARFERARTADVDVVNHLARRRVGEGE